MKKHGLGILKALKKKKSNQNDIPVVTKTEDPIIEPTNPVDESKVSQIETYLTSKQQIKQKVDDTNLTLSLAKALEKASEMEKGLPKLD